VRDDGGRGDEAGHHQSDLALDVEARVRTCELPVSATRSHLDVNVLKLPELPLVDSRAGARMASTSNENALFLVRRHGVNSWSSLCNGNGCNIDFLTRNAA